MTVQQQFKVDMKQLDEQIKELSRMMSWEKHKDCVEGLFEFLCSLEENLKKDDFVQVIASGSKWDESEVNYEITRHSK